MSSEIGNILKVSLFGESHGKAIGVVIDNLPPGEEIDAERLFKFLARRAGGKDFSTPRKEDDIPTFLSGVLNGKTTGAPLCAVIENKNTRSSDYSSFAHTPRPSHADYPAFVKYGGYNDPSGGGHFSGRLTAALCVAGGICLQILERRGINIAAHIYNIDGVNDRPFDPCNPDDGCFKSLTRSDFPVIDQNSAEAMLEKIRAAKDEGDSVGGTVECAVTGMPTGIGSPCFGSAEGRLSAAIFGLGAVRGVEFGAGFAAACMRGSEHNDPYFINRDGNIATRTNNHGGVIGGITSGMPIVFRVAFKPTASIALEQATVDMIEHRKAKIKIAGRHDPCIVPRAVPCVESAAAITIMDLLLEQDKTEM